MNSAGAAQSVVSHPARLRLTGSDASAVFKARRTLVQFGQYDDVKALDRRLASALGPPTVMVVGEVKRGKSTLVNALTGIVVSPMGADTVIPVAIAVVPPARDLAEGSAELLYPARKAVVTTAEAMRLLEPSFDGAELERPVGARMAVASRWLPGVALIDTPGVGGLMSAHGRRAKVASGEASALVFVTDGGQTLTSHELAFLRDVSERTEHVVLALTKTDRNPGGWEQVRDENRILLQRHAPRFAGLYIHAVAAPYALHAVGQPAATAALLEQTSAIPGLAEAINDLIADNHRLVVANALRAGHSALQRTRDRVELALRAVEDVAVREDLQSEEARLAALQLQQRRARLDLERDLGRVRQAAIAFVNERCDEIIERMSERIKQERRGVKEAAKEQFAAELVSELTLLEADVRRFVGSRLAGVVEAAFGSLEAVPVGAGDVVTELTTVEARVRQRRATAVNPLMDPSVAGTAFMGSHLLGLAGLGGPVGLLFGGGAMVVLNLAFRGVRLGQQELTGTLQDSIAGMKQDLVAAIDSWLRELRPELHIALEDFLKESVAEVRQLIAEATRAAQQDAATHATTVARLQRRSAAVTSRLELVDTRLRELTQE